MRWPLNMFEFLLCTCLLLLLVRSNTNGQAAVASTSDTVDATSSNRPVHLSKLISLQRQHGGNDANEYNAKDVYTQHLLRPLKAGLHHTVSDVLFVTAVATCNMSDSLRAIRSPPATVEQAHDNSSSASFMQHRPMSRVRCRRCTQACYEPCTRQCAAVVAMPPEQVPKYLNINKALLTSDECQELLDCNLFRCHTTSVDVDALNNVSMSAEDTASTMVDDVFTGRAKLARWQKDLQCLVENCSQALPACSAAQFVFTSCFLYQCSHDCVKTCSASDDCLAFCSKMSVDSTRQFWSLFNQWKQAVLESGGGGGRT